MADRWGFYGGWAVPEIATPAQIRERLGRAPTPVRAKPRARKIAQTFWGNAWCAHLEAYRDLSNRLPRGRTYLRKGSVRDLHVDRGRITGLVQGTSLYEVDIAIEPMAESDVAALVERIGGGLDSVVALLEGRLGDSVLRAVTDPAAKLFPARTEITFGCSCPDGARVCKHVAAVFYGVSLRLDAQPELLFVLRGLAPERLVEGVSFGGAPVDDARELRGDLSEIFGVYVEDEAPATLEPSPEPAKRPRKKKRTAEKKTAKKKTAKKKTAKRSR